MKRLREAAEQELAKTPTGVSKPGDLEFDMEHSKTAPNSKDPDEMDRENGVAQYPGPNIPHIGNGSGGIR